MLLILGIVIEELINDCLGTEGHKVFMEQNVEAHDDEDESEGTLDTHTRNGQLDLEDDDNTNREEEEENLDDESSEFGQE